MALLLEHSFAGRIGCPWSCHGPLLLFFFHDGFGVGSTTLEHSDRRGRLAQLRQTRVGPPCPAAGPVGQAAAGVWYQFAARSGGGALINLAGGVRPHGRSR